MTPARSEKINTRTRRQTAEGSGCLSGFLIPPLAALCVGLFLALFASGLAPAAPEAASAQIMAATAPAGGSIAPLFTAEIQFWAPSLVNWAAQNGVDVNLAATVMQIESCGNPEARSSAGAAGLFQVMPFHFYALENAYDPDTNALRGLDYLRRALEKAGGNARLALAGYNGGIGVISRVEAAWPAETIRYAYWGAGIYADAAQNASASARLNEWLAAGGASLCRKAHQRLGLP
jgi:soluble lytic murein transglycosylase-like protein